MSKYDDLRRLREARFAEAPNAEGSGGRATPEAVGVAATPPRASSPPPSIRERFDRKAYQREYMRGYMRKRRAAAKG
jgi:hypothetical protein